eukprot:354726-Chlamydomonas_euryale.AAC.8
MAWVTAVCRCLHPLLHPASAGASSLCRCIQPLQVQPALAGARPIGWCNLNVSFVQWYALSRNAAPRRSRTLHDGLQGLGHICKKVWPL